MSEFLSAYGAGLGIVAGLVCVALVMFHPAARSVRFWFMDWAYGFPLIGKLARLSKDPTRAADGLWMNAERALCADYKKFVSFLGKSAFLQRVEYMQHARDLGRTPTPIWAIFLLAVLVIAEGLGFSYLLGGMIAADGSANTRTLLMVGVVLTICLITVAVMHAAGHNFYRNALINDCKRSFKERGSDGSFLSEKMALKDLQEKDAEQPEHIRCANRVCSGKTDRPKYGSIVSAIALIVAIAIGSTWMRWSNMEKDLIEGTTAGEQAQAGNPFSQGGTVLSANIGGVGVNVGVSGLPGDVAAPQQEADAKAKAELASATKSGSLAGFIMLAVIFVITQLVGIGVGYKYGFAAPNSKEAYEQTRGFSTYDAYYDYYRHYIEIASARLQQLQQKLEEDSGNKLKLDKTFHEYIAYANRKDQELMDGHDTKLPPSSVPPATPAAQAPREDGDGRVQTQLTKLDALADKEAKKRHLDALQAVDEMLHDSVVAALRVRKEAEARRLEAEKARAADLDSLL